MQPGITQEQAPHVRNIIAGDVINGRIVLERNSTEAETGLGGHARDHNRKRKQDHPNRHTSQPSARIAFLMKQAAVKKAKTRKGKEGATKTHHSTGNNDEGEPGRQRGTTGKASQQPGNSQGSARGGSEQGTSNAEEGEAGEAGMYSEEEREGEDPEYQSDQEEESGAGREDAGAEGIRIATLNLGSGGLRKSLASIRAWALGERIGVLHLQEVYNLNPKKEGRNHRRREWTDVTKYIPEYSLIHGHGGDDPATDRRIVATLVRKSLMQWTTVLPLKMRAVYEGPSPLQGRALAVRLDMPQKEPITLVNVWMPDSSRGLPRQAEAYHELGRMLSVWTSEHKHVLVAGDMNAALYSTHDINFRNPLARPLGGTAEGDALLSHLIRDHHLTADKICTPTWEGHNAEAKLDYILWSTGVQVKQDPAIDETHDVCTDHLALSATLGEKHGLLPPDKQRNPPVRLRTEHIEELASVYKSHVQEELRKLGTPDLGQAREAMWKAALEVFGTQKLPTLRPRHRDAEMKERNAEIRALRQLSKLVSEQERHSKEGADAQWAEWRHRARGSQGLLPTATIPPNIPQGRDAEEVLKSLKGLIAAARRERDNAIRERDREEMQTNCDRARNRLDSGKRGIRQAMGKLSANHDLTRLHTDHPQSFEFRTQGRRNAEMERVIRGLDSKAELKFAGEVAMCRISELDKFSTILGAVQQQGGQITRILQTTTIARTEEDLLAALEHKLGDDGRAREWQCPQCKQHSSLTTVASRDEETASRCTKTLCRTCRTLVEPIKGEKTYSQVPWGGGIGIFESHRKVPGDTPLSLTDTIPLRELRRVIRNLKNNKAPGDDHMLAELYKYAPDEALQPLLEQVNKCLQGESLPEEWRGGIVKLLLKKEPADTLGNWRPVCMANTEYKIYSQIITIRLQRIAESHGILETSQEGFRAERSTRRQIERLLHVLYKARDERKRVYLALLDFTNAFNSIDLEPSFLLLESYGIPDVHIIRNMYEGAHFKAEANGRFTAQISLSRGTKQGDPLSPPSSIW